MDVENRKSGVAISDLICIFAIVRTIVKIHTPLSVCLHSMKRQQKRSNICNSYDLFKTALVCARDVLKSFSSIEIEKLSIEYNLLIVSVNSPIV